MIPRESRRAAIGRLCLVPLAAAAGVTNPTLASLVAADYVQKNPSTVRAFAGVLAKAAAYANTHQPQTAPILAKYSGIELSTVAHMTRARFETALDPRDIQPVIDAAARYRVIPKGFDARDIIAVYS